MRALVLLALLLGNTGSAPAGPVLEIVGDQFSYSDEQGSAHGRILLPTGAGVHGALVLSHGQGGSPGGLPNWSQFASWNVVLIAPELTHVLGGETAPATSGFTPENMSRIHASVRALALTGRVDLARIGMFGHSKGAYATIGAVARLDSTVRAAAVTAGGVVPDSVGTEQSAPTYAESAGVVAPFLMLHGNIDPAVPPTRSLDFSTRLSAAGVVNQRVVYDVGALPPSTQHNFHQDPTINADLVLRLHDWFDVHGVLATADASLYHDGFE